eukprot:TRINITY_DN2974_c0_g1_i1.p1 TRINITY_DN2974_c0_g1~~TRINITY_DN2974_c0_g1_i1.p1  ORF type:complete len:72 (+),score=28.29 TRINITY_DN2974_c0_g1_i1:19-234(+)
MNAKQWYQRRVHGVVTLLLFCTMDVDSDPVDENFPTEEFDAIILGTGLKECIISGLLSNGRSSETAKAHRG